MGKRPDWFISFYRVTESVLQLDTSRLISIWAADSYDVSETTGEAKCASMTD
jgi:hypothetical protein